MSDGLEFILLFLFMIGIAAVIGAVAYVVLRLRAGEPFLISLGFLLRVYLYLGSLISLLILMNGLAGLANAGLGQAVHQGVQLPTGIRLPTRSHTRAGNGDGEAHRG